LIKAEITKNLTCKNSKANDTAHIKKRLIKNAINVNILKITLRAWRLL